MLIHENFSWEDFELNKKNCQFPKVKIADFGLSKNVQEGKGNFTIAGTKGYIAPGNPTFVYHNSIFNNQKKKKSF